jgi:hypothetical protein
MTTNSCVSHINGTAHSNTLHDIEVAGYRYVMLTICIFGIFCNILNLCVLLQRRLKESPYTYLTGLALADMLTLISISPVSIVRGDYIRHENIFFALTRLEAQIYMPLANYFGQVSIMITVALTMERYLFTTYPLRTQSFCQPTYARRVIAIILILCLITNIPRFLTETVEQIIGTDSTFQYSKCSTHPFIIQYSSTNDSHIGQCFCVHSYTRSKFVSIKNYYYSIMLVLNQILPFAILLCLNLSLIRRVQMSNRFTLKELIARENINHGSTTPTINTAKQKRLRDEHRLTKTLVAVVIVFLVCNTFTIVSYPGLVRLITQKRYPNYFQTGFRIQRLITNIMLLLNYSINFFFYCAFNQKFLDTLKITFRYENLFCRKLSSSHRTSSTHSSMSLPSKVCTTNQYISSCRINSEDMNQRRKLKGSFTTNDDL